MKILLIGARGLVGSDFSHQAVNHFEIDAIDSRNSERCFGLLKANHYDFLIFTAQSKGYKSLKFLEDLFHVNISYFFNIVRSSIGKADNIIFFSSGSVYNNTGKLLTETSPLDLDSSSPYVVSKICAELILKPFIEDFRSITVLRPFFIYGPNQNPQMLIQSMIYKVKSQQEIVLNNNEGLIFNPVYVGDVTDFLIKIILSDIRGFHIYNVFGPEKTSLGHILSALSSRMQIPPKVTIKDAPPNVLLAGTIHSEYQPNINVDEGLARTLNAEK